MTATILRRTPIDLATPCEVWAGDKSDQGYGRIMIDARTLYVHRLAYQLHVGPISRGWQIDHLCHNAAYDAGTCGAGPCQHRACMNPAHLEAVTTAENSRRGGHPLYVVRRQDRCQRGHDMTDAANVKVRTNGTRRCRECDRLTQQARRTRQGGGS